MKAWAQHHPDALAVAALVLLWLLFFWRLFTPIEADQASLKQGDFSGQFVAFAAYQYERFSQGQIPLWNPYNNGGLPFIADTQAAVFYPPRLLALAAANLIGGFSYRVLEWEMTAHVLLYTLLMYLFIRRLASDQRGTHIASFISAVIAGYSGFMTGYAPLQLAILEAATWLPLALLGIHLATQQTVSPATFSVLSTQYSALALTGFALGISWMAGHPQTSFFMTWLLLAYLAFRINRRGWSWRTFIVGAVVFGLIAFGLAAVQLIPGVEYLRLTTRSGFGFDAKGNGFPIHDVFQFFVPHVVSLFSPLYVGVAGLLLALIALWRRGAESLFWGAAALIALLWSFGANSLLYPLLYNTLPGAYFFRGQERAAFVVANAGAILAGLGFVRLMAWRALPNTAPSRQLRRLLWGIAIALSLITAVVLVAWLANRDAYGAFMPYFAFSQLVALACALLMPRIARHRFGYTHLLLAALIIFELFTVNMNADAVYDPVPPSQQLNLTPPSLVQQALDDPLTPFRVDGFRGLGDNYGSLYGVADIRGISPLWLESAHALVEGDLPDPIAWELFAVRYVFTDWNELPIPSQIIGRGADRYGDINLHLLTNPRPFILPMDSYEVITDDAAARARLADPAFNPRSTILLDQELEITPASPETVQIANVEQAPEQLTIEVNSPASTLFSVSMVDYPGWDATINDQPVDILRAYGGLMAVVVPEGDSTIRLTYDPLSYRVGAAISLATWAGIAILIVVMPFRCRRLKCSKR
jgi:hypothetical protein